MYCRRPRTTSWSESVNLDLIMVETWFTYQPQDFGHDSTKIWAWGIIWDHCQEPHNDLKVKNRVEGLPLCPHLPECNQSHLRIPPSVFTHPGSPPSMSWTPTMTCLYVITSQGNPPPSMSAPTQEPSMSSLNLDDLPQCPHNPWMWPLYVNTIQEGPPYMFPPKQDNPLVCPCQPKVILLYVLTHLKWPPLQPCPPKATPPTSLCPCCKEWAPHICLHLPE